MKYPPPILFFIFLFFSCTEKPEIKDTNTPKEAFKTFNGVEESDSNTPYKIIDTLLPLSNNQQKATLVSVLVYYGVPVRYDGNTLTIPESSFKDMNYLYNITIKSKDSAWLSEHILTKN
jgi:hypothetical protein